MGQFSQHPFAVRWALAWPSCRVVRLSISEYLNFVAPCGVQVGDELGRIELSVAGSIRGKWRWIMSSAAPLHMPVGLCQVALHDQARAVLRQGMADEAHNNAGARGLPVAPGLRVGGRAMGGVEAILAPEIEAVSLVVV